MEGGASHHPFTMLISPDAHSAPKQDNDNLMQQIKFPTYTHPPAIDAINFALDCLQPYEIAEFLDEWRRGVCLTPWAGALMEDTTCKPYETPVSMAPRNDRRVIDHADTEPTGTTSLPGGQQEDAGRADKREPVHSG